MAQDSLELSVSGIEVPVLTGVYSEETHLPQPLRISVRAGLSLPSERFAPDTPLACSKNYLDLRRAATTFPDGLHFTLIESVAEHICMTLFAEDERVRHVAVEIVKLAISEHGEEIGIRFVRDRPAGMA